jgi:hypothetical protein
MLPHCTESMFAEEMNGLLNCANESAELDVR